MKTKKTKTNGNQIKLKTQTILRMKISLSHDDENSFFIVLAFTSHKEFVTWESDKDSNFSSGHYHNNFNDAYEDFKTRCATWCHPIEDNANNLEYFARREGYAEIVWDDKN